MCKKHYLDFTNDEKVLIERLIKKIEKEPTIIFHALCRMLQKKIPSEEVYRVLKDYDIIEYNKVKCSHRVLLRGKNTYRKRNVSISIDLFTHEIVTVYSNNKSDTHVNLRENEYTKNINIIKEINTYLNNKQYCKHNSNYQRMVLNAK